MNPFLTCFFFNLQKYVENVKQDTNIGTNILRVSASDEDADNNGAIVYNLTAYNSHDLEYFTILPESGWIVLTKPLDVSLSEPFIIFLNVKFLRFNISKSCMACDKTYVFTHGRLFVFFFSCFSFQCLNQIKMMIMYRPTT